LRLISICYMLLLFRPHRKIAHRLHLDKHDEHVRPFRALCSLTLGFIKGMARVDTIHETLYLAEEVWQSRYAQARAGPSRVVGPSIGFWEDV
jgi:hypothetical protein